ncbi:DUF421 domain-containing protein [Salinisphaera hydrothermalis]|uniref:YetF C-terminal domain-containing protein n=1 Tax=Salinisphaera hydrothermalis (strain C41B8) TaxID=1304275 RepID=A0A084IRP9_SALHC|nr:YetF domain-containing protein [Salinisphaera hydrothermalis]KEZ79383.1 hypothetical protein C41B8_01500 [Salinisphaera hydrothermalis C41B8]
MIETSWLGASASSVLSMLVSTLGIYVALLLFTRLSGLRSFSKMSSFDFAITVALGSILASTVLSKNPALLTGVGALAVLYLIQYVVARGRRTSPWVKRLVDNEPRVLMAGEDILAHNMRAARITEGDLNSKLRLAGITHRAQVLAVVMESTGDVSVMRRGEDIDPRLFQDVRDAERIPGVPSR